jgi:Skp family chaperone for outer membrane proteins
MRPLIIALAVAIAAAGGIAIHSHSAIAQTATQAPAQGAAATSKVPVVVGILDMQTILKQSKAGKSLDAVKAAKSKAMNAEMGKTEQTLRSNRQKLDQARSSMSQADYEAKRAEIDKQFDALRKTVIAKRKELVQIHNAGIEQIFDVLDGVIRDIAGKRGITLIINRSFVVMSEQSWDITKEALAGLDAKLPKVKL